MDDLRPRIEASWAGGPLDREAVEAVMEALDTGRLRVAEKQGDAWVTHAWVKSAILLYFRMMEMHLGSYGDYVYHDKIPLKTRLVGQNIRVVPPGTVVGSEAETELTWKPQ